MRPSTRTMLMALLVGVPASAIGQNSQNQASSAAAAASVAAGTTSADSAAIRATALDYIDGWYTGDAARMQRALHPDLAKRIVHADSSGADRVDDMDAAALVEATRKGFGTRTPESQRQEDVTILDVFGNAASVKVVATDWVDYLHMGKVDGRWIIVNVLWELKPGRG